MTFQLVVIRPFPSSLVPLFQNESKCETFHMKMSFACSFIFMQIKVISIRMVSHLDSFWNRGTRELGNGLLNTRWKYKQTICLPHFDRFQIKKWGATLNFLPLFTNRLHVSQMTNYDNNVLCFYYIQSVLLIYTRCYLVAIRKRKFKRE